MKEYKYGKLSAGLSGKTGPIIMLLTVLVFVCLAIATGHLETLGGSLIFALLYGIFIFGFSWWPNIKSDGEALYLEFLGWPIKIPWEDVLDIQAIHYLPQKAWLVTARKITFLHYLYSLLVSLKPVPGFVIWESLPNHSDLVGNIRREIKKRK